MFNNIKVLSRSRLFVLLIFIKKKEIFSKWLFHVIFWSTVATAEYSHTYQSSHYRARTAASAHTVSLAAAERIYQSGPTLSVNVCLYRWLMFLLFYQALIFLSVSLGGDATSPAYVVNYGIVKLPTRKLKGNDNWKHTK